MGRSGQAVDLVTVPPVEELDPGIPSDETVDLATFCSRADRAYVTSRNVDRRVNELFDLLGLNRNTLDMRRFAIEELDRDVSRALLDAEPPHLKDIRRWAGVFFAVDEAYLLLLEKYVGTDEPWKKLMDLSYKLVVEAPHERFPDEPDLRTAYGYLQAARSQLRTVAYFYCRERYGPELTQTVFGTPGSVTDRILGLLYRD